MKDDLITEFSVAQALPREKLYNLTVDTDLDTYVDIYATDKSNLIQALKELPNISEIIQYIFRNYDVKDLEINLNFPDKIRITFNRPGNRVLPQDTITNASKFDESNPAYSSIDRANISTNSEELSMIMSSILESKPELINEYNALVDRVLSTYDYKVIKSEKNNFIINRQDKYIFKMHNPKLLHPLDFDDRINEAFIGFFGINRLRDRIKNFASILHITFDLKCPPRLSRGFLEKCTCIVYEYVPGIPLAEYVLHIKLSEFKTLFKQIIFALYEAYVELGFTHYDLHPGNGLIEKLSNSITLTYEHANQELLTNQLFHFVDYGTSHIKFEGKDYGRIFAEANAENQTFWVHDVFKIMMHLYRQVSHKSIEINTKLLYDRYGALAELMLRNELIELRKAQENNGVELYQIKVYLARLFIFFLNTEMTDELFDRFHGSNPYYGVRHMKKFDQEKFDFRKFVDLVIAS